MSPLALSLILSDFAQAIALSNQCSLDRVSGSWYRVGFKTIYACSLDDALIKRPHMSELIGMSLSSCVSFICDQGLPIDRVKKIVCGGVGSSNADWSTRLKYECERFGSSSGFRDVAEELRRQGKLSFPGEKRQGGVPWIGFGIWTTDDLFVISADLYSEARNDINKLHFAKGVHCQSIFPGNTDPNNTIVEYDRAAIQSIRAKYRPSVRKAIIKFFKG